MTNNTENAQCIFCKTTSAPFTSIEHIVPESLGNTDHILPRGIVCDPCNNYFASRVEGRILGSDYFRQARHRNGIPSKRNRIPIQEALSFPDAMRLEMGIARDGSRYIRPADESQNDSFVSRLLSSNRLAAVFPVAEPPDQRLFARFLIVMGLEALADRMLPVPCGIEVDHINNQLLDEARAFARYGNGPDVWPFHEVRIYPEGRHFHDLADGTSYDVPHEYTLLLTDNNELYFVIAIFGTQYSINLGGPEIEGFDQWLAANHNQSPLYPQGA